jgi:hypothetical protein
MIWVLNTWEKPQIQPGLFHRFPDLGHENGEQLTPFSAILLDYS